MELDVNTADQDQHQVIVMSKTSATQRVKHQIMWLKSRGIDIDKMRKSKHTKRK